MNDTTQSGEGWIDPADVERVVLQLKAIAPMFDIELGETMGDIYARCNIVRVVVGSVIDDLSNELKSAGIEI